MMNKTPEISKTPKTRVTELRDKPGGWEIEIETAKGNKLVTSREKFDRDFQGLSDEEIGDKLDREFEEDDAQNREAFGEGHDGSHEHDEHSEDDTYEQTEDPLAGDVDPTGGYPEPMLHPEEAHRLEVMRQHGDHTG